jgi:hypothetical protein
MNSLHYVKIGNFYKGEVMHGNIFEFKQTIRKTLQLKVTESEFFSIQAKDLQYFYTSLFPQDHEGGYGTVSGKDKEYFLNICKSALHKRRSLILGELGCDS